MKPLVIIPARGGSKGVPRKNIKLLGGKPLIQYTIEAAREVFSDDVICVTTDSIAIKKSVENLGLKVPFLRPVGLAQDNSGTNEVLVHAVNYYEDMGYLPDTVILLQPTSPFRKGGHIREALDLFSEELDMIVSVKKASSNPYYNLWEEGGDGFLRKSKEGNYLSRQSCPMVYEFNGAIYIIKLDSLKKKPISKFEKVKKYVMEDIYSHDIDTPLDWLIAEFLVRKVFNS